MAYDKPFLSIIVLCYNVEEYIDRCLRSIHEQIFTDYEVIIVDDGSTDDSGKIADKWQEKDARFKVFHIENGNIVAARKYGLSKATGSYVGSVDGDDWIDKEMYEELCKAGIDNDADVVQCSMYMNDRRYIIDKPHMYSTGLYTGDMYRQCLMMEEGSYSTHLIQNSLCSKIVKRELLAEAIEGMDNSCVLGEDAICSIIVAGKAKRHYQIKKCLYHYRVREGSRTGSSESDMAERLCKLSAYGKEQMSKVMPELSWQVDARVRTFIIMTVVQERLMGEMSTVRKEYWKRQLRAPQLQEAMRARLTDKEKLLSVRLAYVLLTKGIVPPLWVFKWMERQEAKYTIKESER